MCLRAQCRVSMCSRAGSARGGPRFEPANTSGLQRSAKFATRAPSAVYEVGAKEFAPLLITLYLVLRTISVVQGLSSVSRPMYEVLERRSRRRMKCGRRSDRPLTDKYPTLGDTRNRKAPPTPARPLYRVLGTRTSYSGRRACNFSGAGCDSANNPRVTHVRLTLLVARAVCELHRDEPVPVIEAAGPGVALERP